MPLAEKGNTVAQFNLAEMYREGSGPKDYKNAVKWFTLSTKQGSDKTQYNLVVLYCFGFGVVTDYKIALNWVCRSAE